MKRWYDVTITSFDEHDQNFRWEQTAVVYAKEGDCIGAAFRQINRPSRNTNVAVRLWY